jgi:hypothetical protein
MINKLKLFTLSLFVGLTLAIPQVSYGSDESQGEEVNSPMTALPVEIKEMILIEIVSRGQSPMRLALLNREWNQIIDDVLQEGNPVWDAWTGVKTPYDEEIYQQFRNMQLIYRPNPYSNKGKIQLSIPMGHNPFKYTFDLSSCGDCDRRMAITNDLERFFTIRGKNENKIVIYFGTHFWINKNIDSLVCPFNTIMTSWEAEQAPIGIFWRFGNCSTDVCDYLTSQPSAELSNVDLHENWQESVEMSETSDDDREMRAWVQFPGDRFHVYLGNQN